MVYGHVSDPKALWEQFAHNLCDDLPHWLQSMNGVPHNFMDLHLDYGFYLLEGVLAGMGKSLQDYHLPQYSHDWRNSRAIGLQSTTEAVFAKRTIFSAQRGSETLF